LPAGIAEFREPAVGFGEKKQRRLDVGQVFAEVGLVPVVQHLVQ
jgi:hypothetical protein